MIKKYEILFICILSYVYSGILMPVEQRENTIELQVEETSSHSLSIKLGIGSPPQYLGFYFSTILQRVYIAGSSKFPDGFDPSKSSSFHSNSEVVLFP